MEKTSGLLLGSAIHSITKMNRNLNLEFPETKTRWIKVIAKNSNGKDWLFVDEIGVE